MREKSALHLSSIICKRSNPSFAYRRESCNEFEQGSICRSESNFPSISDQQSNEEVVAGVCAGGESRPLVHFPIKTTHSFCPLAGLGMVERICYCCCCCFTFRSRSDGRRPIYLGAHTAAPRPRIVSLILLFSRFFPFFYGLSKNVKLGPPWAASLKVQGDQSRCRMQNLEVNKGGGTSSYLTMVVVDVSLTWRSVFQAASSPRPGDHQCAAETFGMFGFGSLLWVLKFF